MAINLGGSTQEVLTGVKDLIGSEAQGPFDENGDVSAASMLQFQHDIMMFGIKMTSASNSLKAQLDGMKTAADNSR